MGELGLGEEPPVYPRLACADGEWRDGGGGVCLNSQGGQNSSAAASFAYVPAVGDSFAVDGHDVPSVAFPAPVSVSADALAYALACAPAYALAGAPAALDAPVAAASAEVLDLRSRHS